MFRSSTDLGAVFPRVFQDDTPEDKAAIQRVLNQVMVYPLTEFDGQMKTKDWSKAPSFPAPAGAGSGETKWVLPEKFFEQQDLLRARARTLAEAAHTMDAFRVADAYGRLSEACVRCHAVYRQGK